MRKIVGIYKITSPSGKVYIGQSRDVKSRWKSYAKPYKQRQPKLNNSFAKHGFVAHVFEIVNELPKDVDQKTLDSYEQLYCDFYSDCGVELLNTRQGKSGGKLSDEAKRRLSEYWTGRNVGIKLTEETKQKIRLAKAKNAQLYIGNKYGRLSKGMTGKTHKNGTKRIMAVKRFIGEWQIYRDNIFLGAFESSIHASQILGIPASTLRRIKNDGRINRSAENKGLKIVIQK